MNKTMLDEAKKALDETLGDAYPKAKEDMTAQFLLMFANYLDGPEEPETFESKEAYKAYEDAKYSSECWRFVSRMSEAQIASENGNLEAWSAYLNWVVENYFPEFSKEA